jgi:acetyltransferase
MQKIFNPQSVAIIGASEKEGKIGNILIKNIKPKNKNRKSKLKIFPVNPKGRKIEGLKVYSSVLDIAEEVDLAVIAVPAKFVNQVVEECAWRETPIKNIIIISAGFGEIGGEGLKRKKGLKDLIKKYKLNVLGPNCLGIINASEDINLSFAKANITEGGIGLISQSGAFITSMIDVAESEQFGFSLIASLGNKLNINENDLLDYYVKDPETKIIAMYLENISDGKKFQTKLKRIAKIKPVIIIKAGNSQKTKEAIQSHTGSLAGESVVIQTVVKDAGGILVDNLEDFVSIIKVLNNFKVSKIQTTGKKEGLVIVTNAGGPGVITTDLTESYGLKLFEFNKKERVALKKKLPEESSVNNPIDLIGDAREDRYQIVLDYLKDIKGIKGVLAIVTPQAQTPIKKIVENIAEYNKKMPFPTFPIVIGGEAKDEAEKVAGSNGINNFEFPVVLIRALKKIGKWNIPATVLVKQAKGEKSDRISRQEYRTLLSYKESEKLAKEFKLNILPAKYPDNEDDLKNFIKKLKLPIVMKVDSPNIIHKNVKNGVAVGLNTVKKVEEEFRRFQKDFPGEKILIQHQVENGMEIILGLKRDTSFGLVLIIGLGGITTEILDEKILLVGNITNVKIKDKLKKSKLYKILKKEKINVDKLVEQAGRLFELGMLDEKIIEVDVNPIFLYKHKDPVIVDFKIMKISQRGSS